MSPFGRSSLSLKNKQSPIVFVSNFSKEKSKFYYYYKNIEFCNDVNLVSCLSYEIQLEISFF